MLWLLLVVGAAWVRTAAGCPVRFAAEEVMASSVMTTREASSCRLEGLSYVREEVSAAEHHEEIGCNERYPQRLRCGKNATWLTTRADFVHCDGTRCRRKMGALARRRGDVFLLNDDDPGHKGSWENAAWMCKDGGLAAFSGVGYGGGRGIHYADFFLAAADAAGRLSPRLSQKKKKSTVVLSANSSESGCRESVSYMAKSDKCAFDGKLSVVPFGGELLIFARLNRCRRGGRSVQMATLDSHSKDLTGRFEPLHFDGVDDDTADFNVYYFVVAEAEAEAKNNFESSSRLVALFPGVVAGVGGVFATATHSADLRRWTRPTLLLESPAARAWRTTDHVVDLRVVVVVDEDIMQGRKRTLDVSFGLLRGVSLPRTLAEERNVDKKCNATTTCPRCYRGDERPTLCEYRALLRTDRTGTLRPVEARVHVVFAGELRVRDEPHFAEIAASCEGALTYVVSYPRYAPLASRLAPAERTLIVPDPELRRVVVVEKKKPTTTTTRKTMANVTKEWFRSLCAKLGRRPPKEQAACDASLEDVRVSAAYPGAIQWGVLDLAVREWFLRSAVDRSDLIVRARTDLRLKIGPQPGQVFRYADLASPTTTAIGKKFYCHSDKLFFASVAVFLEVIAGFRDGMMADFNGNKRSKEVGQFLSERAFADHVERITGAPCLDVRRVLCGGGGSRCNKTLHASLDKDRRTFSFLGAAGDPPGRHLLTREGRPSEEATR